MLIKLHIENFAIIDFLEIDYPKGFTVITGETGAGKSIVMDALKLILGARADSANLIPGKKCIVEGNFSTRDNPSVNAYLALNDLDSLEELVIRREISLAGKSRSFINDTPVGLQQLEELGFLLVDLHQQFDTAEITSSNFQKHVLDSLAGNLEIRKSLSDQYAKLLLLRKEMAELELLKERAVRESDYDRYLLEELEQFATRENEMEELEIEQKLLSNSEEIISALELSGRMLEDGDGAVLLKLKQILQRLENLKDNFPAVSELTVRMRSCMLELKDLQEEIGSVKGEVTSDEQRLQIVSERLSEGYRLLKKHGCKSTSQLMELMASLKNKLYSLDSLEERLVALKRSSADLEGEAVSLAKNISAKRKKITASFEEQVNLLLKRVGMIHAAVKVEIQPAELDASGIDRIEFLFQANLVPGSNTSTFQPLAKVASGGELSRLMLCIKSLVANVMELPTLVFDEIDTGISGEAALQVGNIMRELSVSRQVIAITHQPQLASRADTHFYVQKEKRKDAIRTAVKKLDRSGRVEAIARMLSGDKPTATAIANAEEMVAGQ
jgi:DNA repair protein RecN (Recombination protein N)